MRQREVKNTGGGGGEEWRMCLRWKSGQCVCVGGGLGCLESCVGGSLLPIRPAMCHSDTKVMPLWTTTPCSCSCLCVTVYVYVCAGWIGYQTTCLPKPQFNFGGTVHMLYNIIIRSNEEHSSDKEVYNQVMASTQC